MKMKINFLVLAAILFGTGIFVSVATIFGASPSPTPAATPWNIPCPDGDMNGNRMIISPDGKITRWRQQIRNPEDITKKGDCEWNSVEQVTAPPLNGDDHFVADDIDNDLNTNIPQFIGATEPGRRPDDIIEAGPSPSWT